MSDLSDMCEDVMNQVVSAMKEAEHYREELCKYSHLWQDDREEFMEQFLLYSKVLTPKDIEACGDEPMPKNPPTLKEFKEEVGMFFRCFSHCEVKKKKKKKGINVMKEGPKPQLT